ncbi:class I SAM-dependent methyltransferase [soil metagenome]
MNVPDPGRNKKEIDAGAGAVRRQYASQAAEYERRWQSYLRATIEPTLSALAARSGERILDLGCGTGLLLRELGEATIGTVACGVDLSVDMLQVALEHSSVLRLAAADAHHLPFQHAAFDAVVSSSSMHHWARPDEVLTEIARILRPGGRLVVTDWADDFLMTRALSLVLRVTDRSHMRTYDAENTCAMIENAGFRVVRCQLYKEGWKWGFMTISAELPMGTR